MGLLKKVIPLIMVASIAMFGCASDDEKKVSHFEKGRAYFEKGEYKSAALEFKNAIQIDPQFVQAQESLGETCLKLGDPRGRLPRTRRWQSLILKIRPLS